MSDLPEPRIADADRDHVSQQLRMAYSEGRITEGELEDRLTAVYEALTASELSVVVADLPAPPLSAAEASPRTRSSVDLRPAAPLLLAPVICTLIYAMTNFGGYFWPMWVWFGCAIPAFGAVFGARGQGDEPDDPPVAPPTPPEVRP